MRRLQLVIALLFFGCAGAALGAEVPDAARAALAREEAVEVVVRLRERPPAGEQRAARRARLADAKRRLAEALERDYEVLKAYPELPMLALRVRSAAALERLAAHPEVAEVFENRRYQLQLAQSLPLVGQPATAAAGLSGTGATVAVIDTAVDYANAAFGCSAPGVPAGCKVAAAVEFAPGGDSGHGTNVAAVVVGVAPGARIISLDVFAAAGATTADIVDAIDWAIANRAAYNIVALNLSLGDNASYAAPCTDGNPLHAPLAAARSAGILAVAASGNNGHLDGISAPACTPDVVSVGAVYDSNLGGVSWTGCSDASTAPDKVTCFSNSGPLLMLLAPGALITAGGSTRGGTSQATPHVAGAVAVLRAAFPAESLNQIVQRLTSSGVPVADARNGLVRPRLAEAAAAHPANDAFAARQVLAGGSGAAAASNRLATLEAGEPAHAGAPGGASVWFTWTAPLTGQASFDTAGSGIDTLLAAYSGTQLAALQPVARNDDGTGLGGASRIWFQAPAGATYQIAVDGKGSASGDLALGWSLNTAPLADLSVSLLESADSVPQGAPFSYTVVLSNAGPQPATGVHAILSLPAGVSVTGLPPGCVSTGQQVTCTADFVEALVPVQYAIQLVAGAQGSAAASVEVSADTPDPSSANNSVQVTTQVTAPVVARVPLLPPFGYALLALALAGLAANPFGLRRPFRAHTAAKCGD